MFDIVKGNIDIISFLEDKFGYTYTGDLNDLYSKPFIEMEGNGVDAMFWIIYQDERYLFKPLKSPEHNIWGELLSQKFAEKLGIPCAKYRCASFGELKGVLSKSFLHEGERMVLGTEFFQNFFNNYSTADYDLIDNKEFLDLYAVPEDIQALDKKTKLRKIFMHFNNLEDIWAVLDYMYPNKGEVKNMIESLLKVVLFDIKTNQIDRHPNNWAIIEKEDGDDVISPLFDNSTAFGLGHIYMDSQISKFKSAILNSRFYGNMDEVYGLMYNYKPSLTISNSDRYEKFSSLELLSEVLVQSSDEEKKEIEWMMKAIKPEELEEIIKELEEENEITMEPGLFYYITEMYLIHYGKICEVLDKCIGEKKYEKAK